MGIVNICHERQSGAMGMEPLAACCDADAKLNRASSSNAASSRKCQSRICDCLPIVATSQSRPRPSIPRVYVLFQRVSVADQAAVGWQLSGKRNNRGTRFVILFICRIVGCGRSTDGHNSDCAVFITVRLDCCYPSYATSHFHTHPLSWPYFATRGVRCQETLLLPLYNIIAIEFFNFR